MGRGRQASGQVEEAGRQLGKQAGWLADKQAVRGWVVGLPEHAGWMAYWMGWREGQG